MKELDNIILLNDYKGIPRGNVGVIVHVYPDTYCEVEFFNKEGETIDVITTPLNIIEVIK